MELKKGPHGVSWTRKLTGRALNVALLIMVAILLYFTVHLVRIKMLQNAQELGMALAKSYAVEEQMNIDALQHYAGLAGEYLDEISSDGSDFQEIQTWLESYFIKLTNIVGDQTVDPYAVIDGYIVAANPWDGDGDYRYEETTWYKQAIDAQGEVVCSDVYVDAITGERVFTISKALHNEGDVFAMDVYIQNASAHNSTYTLPAGSSCYLCDQNGVLLRSVTEWDASEVDLQSYGSFLMEGIRDGSLLAYDATFEDPMGVVKGAYYSPMSNGWTVILTIPINSILMGDRNYVVYVIAIIAVLLFAALAFMTVRDMIQNRKMSRAADTIKMLGDSFYAIYRINFRDGTYEAIKVNPDIADKLPARGDYALVMKAMETVVKPETFHVFVQSFSLESIRQRVKERIADYGGSYERKFGDRYYWVNIRTLYNAKVAPDEVILCFRYVDEEKRQELQHSIILQNALETMQHSTEAKTDFFSRMSHDMRTPLNAVIGCCDLALKSYKAGDYGKVHEYLEKIEFAGKQLLDLINDILELSRMEAGKNYLQEKPFDLRQLLTNITDIFRDVAETEGKTFVVDLNLRQNMVIGDEQKISQIVNNLLSNSFKYSNPGAQIRLEARQFGEQRHGKYQIVVEDTGIGMSEGFLEHLFEPYLRETVFSAHSKLGAGLGMPIVKNLVQRMNGEISVESKLGKGSRFSVTIPLQNMEGHEAEALGKDSVKHEAFDWNGRRVLVAEDNDLNMEIITEVLSQLGAQVVPAENGAEAVHQFETSDSFFFDVILMDMQMPVMDGCELQLSGL